MSHGDDDDSGDDDAQLRSLRAVWLAMPDENPPERGLDALLAAARTKAEEMAASNEVPAAGSNTMPATPSWWERFVAGFRRPPVLAFATVIILVAGVAVIGNRQMSSEPASVPTQSVPASQDEPSTQRREKESLKQEAPPPAETKDMVAPRVPDQVRGPALTDRNNESADSITTTAGEGKVTANEAEDEAQEKQKLFDAAKTAAARGDCSSARSVALQLQKQDLGYYQSRVVPDRGIADCLQEHKTGAAAAPERATTIEPAD